MLRKLYQALTILVLCAAMVIVTIITPQTSQAQTTSQNLIVDPGFESPFGMQDGIPEASVAQGWRAWWVDVAPSYVKKPSNCDDTAKSDCYWARPKFELVALAVFPDHVHSGGQAQQYSSFGRMHEGGLYQRVTGLTSGTTLRFSIYMQAWQCANLSDCGKGGSHSDQPYAMHLKVGIDPTGGTDPFSSNVVWSPEGEAFDQWVEFAVQAKAQGDAVTVFTHSRAEFDWARQLNNVYLDDASLAVASGEAATPVAQPVATTQPTETLAPAAATQSAGTPAPTNPPAPAQTPSGEGAVVHVVQAGDSLYGISLQYNVSVDDLLKLNNLTRESILSIGQQIIVKAGPGGVVAQQPTATPKATVAPTIQATSAPTATATVTALQSPLPTPAPPSATPVSGGLCMSAFEDTNGNTFRDGNEPSLAGVIFVISSGGAEVAHYETDNSAKPYCLTTLPPGAYSVQVTLPPGYVSALDKADVALALGQQIDLAVAARQGERTTPTVTPTVQVQATPSASPMPNTALIAVVLFAIAFLILIGAAILIIRRGR